MDDPTACFPECDGTNRPAGSKPCWFHDAAGLAESRFIDWITPPGETRITSPSGGQKGQKLARFDLIPAQAMWKVAELYGAGAGKYTDHNWRRGYDWSLAMAALERHYNLFKSGEDIDPENGQPHMAAVVFHALTLLTFMDEQPDYDDRWKK